MLIYILMHKTIFCISGHLNILLKEMPQKDEASNHLTDKTYAMISEIPNWYM